MIPPWRIRLTQRTRSEKSLRICISIGSSYREFTPDDARQIADRLHDLADRIDSEQSADAVREVACPTTSSD